MKTTDIFKQEKKIFMAWFFSYATITILAICILFGLYINKSFNTTTSVVQGIEGDYNSQEVIK